MGSLTEARRHGGSKLNLELKKAGSLKEGRAGSPSTPLSGGSNPSLEGPATHDLRPAGRHFSRDGHAATSPSRQHSPRNDIPAARKTNVASPSCLIAIPRWNARQTQSGMEPPKDNLPAFQIKFVRYAVMSSSPLRTRLNLELKNSGLVFPLPKPCPSGQVIDETTSTDWHHSSVWRNP